MSELFELEWIRIVLTIIIVVVVAAIATWLTTRLLKKVLMSDKGYLPSGSIFVNITRAIIWVIALSIILDSCFGINASAISAAVGVGGIALSLGFQDTIANLIGGLQVSLTRLIKPGDKIRVTGESGTVIDITWRHVTIENAEGETAIIPNAVVNKAALVKIEEADEESNEH